MISCCHFIPTPNLSDAQPVEDVQPMEESWKGPQRISGTNGGPSPNTIRIPISW